MRLSHLYFVLDIETGELRVYSNLQPGYHVVPLDKTYRYVIEDCAIALSKLNEVKNGKKSEA